jgi:hypothetical protein
VLEEDVFTSDGVGLGGDSWGGFGCDRDQFLEGDVAIPSLAGGHSPTSEEGVDRDGGESG